MLEFSMKTDRAKTISDLALRAADDLNSMLIELLEDADDQKSKEYKKLIGSILGELYCGVLRPIYDLYPNLAPDELKTK